MDTRICNCCEQSKSLRTAFSRTDTYKDGSPRYRATCKECCKEAMRIKRADASFKKHENNLRKARKKKPSKAHSKSLLSPTDNIPINSRKLPSTPISEGQLFTKRDKLPEWVNGPMKMHISRSKDVELNDLLLLSDDKIVELLTGLGMPVSSIHRAIEKYRAK